MELFISIQSKIKHADWPYILQNLGIFFFLVWVGTLFFEETLLLIYLLFLVLFYITVTQFHIYRLQRQEQEYQLYKYQCIADIHKVLPLTAPLPPMTGWAATPELASTVLKTVQKYKPNQIVELGSGVTTLISGYSLNEFHPSGRVISLDHDSVFAEKTRQEIALHGLEDKIDLRIAPLETHTISGKEWTWYSADQLHFDEPIDLLLVDGPPFKTQKNARYPALPLLFKHLSDRAVIIIHDTDRKSESESIQQWIDEFDDLQMERLDTEKGITLLRKGF